jgi:hypothetical protein
LEAAFPYVVLSRDLEFFSAPLAGEAVAVETRTKGGGTQKSSSFVEVDLAVIDIK